MAPDSLPARARSLWETAAATPVSFPPRGGLAVAVSPDSGLCPPSWAGIVVLDGAAIATAPTAHAAGVLRAALGALPVASLTDLAMVRTRVAVADVLGPATLAYLSPAAFRPAAGGESAEHLDPGHPEVAGLLRAAGREDADESGLAGIDSPAFVLRAGAEVVAAAGYEVWPTSVAHISVLTAPGWRGRGLARRAASAATAHALAAGLLPQWRARPAASRRVARALGFTELGGQLSLRPGGGRNG
ncbi:GNAT family N-acetyltransferase [Streptomyces litchfieldiae]|uniref:GNAT family N-acetyltransferase n=1 Tax=Streptomyces litchfieldiae TaxID=3075543 RepID=A0ABU2N0B1_9ACTN|nr:GNAT family N-acetyltransferase [Streptomyces sp. DSM 44938]MDT0347206.1 GNAT family N-acetyltransferase [Streptomyces sp. DSM 44938]